LLEFRANSQSAANEMKTIYDLFLVLSGQLFYEIYTRARNPQ